MITQEILDTFVYETPAGSFIVIDPTEQDGAIGFYPTKEVAEGAFKQYIENEGIIFE
jgi:hypothetical protein